MEETINNLKKYIERDPYWNGEFKPVTDFEKFCYEHCKDIDNLISAYKKLEEDFKDIDKECNRLEEKEYNKEDQYLVRINELEKELNEENKISMILANNDKFKEQIIDKMAEQLQGLAIFDVQKDEPLILGDKEDIKQYFINKVKENKEC